MSDKPKFDPNQPFEPAASSQPKAKPKFDPEKPFEPSDTAQPGVQAIGSPEGPQAQEPDWVDRTKAVAEGALEHLPMGVGPAVKIAKLLGQTAPVQAAGRLLSVPGNVARTGLAAGLESILPGKNQVTMQDGMNALTGSAPGVGDQIIRKYPSTDIGVGIPGTNNKRLTSRDIMNLLGNVATDPLMYGAVQKTGAGMYDSSIGKIIGEGKRFGKGSVGETYNKYGIKNPLTMDSTVQNIVDQNMAKTGAMETAASKAGAEADIVGAMDPAQSIVNRVKKFAKPGSSEEAMAKEMQNEIDLHKAMAPRTDFTQAPENTGMATAREASPGELKQIGPDGKFSGDPLTRYFGEPIADSKPPLVEAPKPVPRAVQQRLDTRNAYDYTPPTPESVAAELSAKLKQTPLEPAPTQTSLGGWKAPAPNADALPSLPVQGTTTQIAGPTPEATSQWKTDAYDKAKNAAYDTTKRTTAWQGFYKSLGYGLKEATEKAIEKTLGPDAAEEYRQTNADTGNLLSTKKASAMQQAQNDRLKASVTTPVPNGTEGVAGGLATALAEGDPIHRLGQGITAMLVQKGAKAAQLAAMPTGYMLRNTPTALTKALAIKNASPWALQGDDNGKK